MGGSDSHFGFNGWQCGGPLLFGGSPRSSFVPCFSVAVFFDLGAGGFGSVLSVAGVGVTDSFYARRLAAHGVHVCVASCSRS